MFKNSIVMVLLSLLPSLAFAHKADYYSPRTFELAMIGLNEEMQQLYEADAPIADIALKQRLLIDDVAQYTGLPDYKTISRIVSSQILCIRKAEQQPKSIRVINCVDPTCETCSEDRARFYEFLKTKVWMSERALYTIRRQ